MSFLSLGVCSIALPTSLRSQSVVLRSNSADSYELLKHAADVEVGIHTIYTVRDPSWKPGMDRDKTQIKRRPGEIANLMLKANLKMEGPM